MPNYYNPYMQGMMNPQGYSGVPYANSTPMMPQQSYAPAPMQSNVIGVDGEVGAKAYMVPNGSQGPIALWDTNDNVIYLRTFNAAGMPNPLRKLRYVEEEPMQNLPAGNSGATVDTSQFVTKQDLEALRQEIRQMSQQQNQNHSGNQSNSVVNNNNGGNKQGRN